MKRMNKAAWTAVAAGATFSAAVCISGCAYGPPPSFNPSRNAEAGVYGPPPIMSEFDASENVPVDVYGPPADFFEDAILSDEEEETEEDAIPEEVIEGSFEAEENVQECVYGPPEMFGEE